MLNNALDQLRREINHNRENLIAMQQEFAKLADSEPDDFKRVTESALSKYALVTRDLLTKIEYLIIANVGLKQQIDTIQEVILNLPDVRDNQALSSKIEDAFKNATSSL